VDDLSLFGSKGYPDVIGRQNFRIRQFVSTITRWNLGFDEVQTVDSACDESRNLRVFRELIFKRAQREVTCHFC
jgi:hypothetical protein